MIENSKINKLLKWFFRNSIGYKNLRADTNSVNSLNSLSLLIDMNSNIKVIENQFKDNNKLINQRKFSRKRRWIGWRKSIDRTCLDHQQIKNTNFKKKSFILKNDFLDHQMDPFISKEDYLNRFWIPKSKLNSQGYQNENQHDQTANRIDLMMNFGNNRNDLCFDDNFVNNNCNKLDNETKSSNFNSSNLSQSGHQLTNSIHHFRTKKSDIVNLLLELKECSICENDLNSPVELTPLEIMPCHCIFHLYCISSHLNLKKFCPFCLKNYSKKQISTYHQKWKNRYWLN